MNRFNGHTWIVAIIAILAYLTIAILEITIGYLIVKLDGLNWSSDIVIGCVITVPIQLSLGIKNLMKRLTYHGFTNEKEEIKKED